MPKTSPSSGSKSAPLPATAPTWVERATELGEAFDVKRHKLGAITKKLPALRLEGSEEDLPKEVGLGLIAAVLAYTDEEEGYWTPDVKAFAEFEPFEGLDHDTMLWFTRALTETWITHARDDRRYAQTFIVRFPHPELLERLRARVYDRDKNHKYGNRVKETIVTALSTCDDPLAWNLLWKMCTNQTGYPWKGDALYAQKQAMERLGITREQEWREIAIPTFGMNERGFRDLDYGERTIRARAIIGGIEFVDLTSNKTYKSLPRAKMGESTRLIEGYKREYEPAKKGIKEGAKELLSWFEDRMHQRGAWSGPFFRDHLLTHPMAKPLLRGLVLEYSIPRTETRGFCRLDSDDALIDLDFEPVDITEADRIWIPTREMLGEQLDAWVKHMIEFQIMQPFDQLGASDFDLDEEHAHALLDRIVSGEYKVDIRTIRKFKKAGLLEVEGYRADSSARGALVYTVSSHTFRLLLGKTPLYRAWRNYEKEPLASEGFRVGSTPCKTRDDILAALREFDTSITTELLRFLQKLELQAPTHS